MHGILHLRLCIFGWLTFWPMDFLIHRASAIFLGVYEPAKQKLLKALPENLSAFAHLVSFIINKQQIGGWVSVKFDSLT